ncbi:hypothetical protein QYE76_050327 [Lolium multiflorum]|uniref:Protein FAR1-RELATED SEQUENCE n=1 Tax=Lolium multiflorum TaxID=4521 RepID=A0AAD8WJ42_LOLMU|nr:hypothetical protein QYE76_050327 [Lolium multiflorum]
MPGRKRASRELESITLMWRHTLNLSQGSGMTYSQMMQSIESMQLNQQGEGSFMDLLTGPMGSENQMFMITGRSEYVYNSDEDYAHGGNACSLNGQPDEYSDAQGDSAYKYNDTWVNPPQSGQNSDNSDGAEQECSQPNIPDNREEPNVASTVDLEGEESDGEVRSVEEDIVQELSQEDIEIYLENESLKAAQTCIAEFEASWQEMIQKYEVGNLKYLKTMWENRKKFVPVFFKNDFFPFIHSTARSEGTNAVFKDNVGSTYSVSSFLSEYDKIADNIEQNEIHEDSITRTTTPTYWCGNDMEVHAGKMYNRKIFYRFQKQLKFTSYLHVQEVEANKKFEVYKSGLAAARDYRTRRYLVIVDLTSEDFNCICSKFNKDGILCSHVLKVLIHLNIVQIPDKYFIARWKPREKKDIRDLRYNVPLEMTGESSQLRFNVLSKVCINVASDGSKSNEKYLFVTQEVKKIAEKLDAMTLAEDKAKEVDPNDKTNEQLGDLGYAETEYGYLNDPKVVKSKGRPTNSAKQNPDGRYRTFVEQFLGKQQITCSHCGSHYHNIQTCESLHLDASLFANNKKSKTNPRDDGWSQKGKKRGARWAQTIGRGPWPGRATYALGAHDPFASFSSRTPSSENLSHERTSRRLQPPLRAENTERKSSPAGRNPPGNSLPEGEIDAIAIVIERDIISIIIIIISTIYTAITTAAPRHRCSNSG